MYDEPTPEHLLEELNRNAAALPLHKLRKLKAEHERHLLALLSRHPESEEVSYSGPIDATHPFDRIRFHREAVEICQTQISLRERGRKPCASPSVDEGRSFKHSEDYRSIQYAGQNHTLTSRQAQVVEILNVAHIQGEAAVSGDRILEQLGTNNSRLRDTFRNNPLWETLIVKGEKKGTYRLSCAGKALAAPEEQS